MTTPLGPASNQSSIQSLAIMQALMDMTRELSVAIDPAEVLQRTCQKFVELLGLGHTTIISFEDGLKTGRVIAEYPDHHMVNAQMPLLPVLIERLIVGKEVIQIDNMQRAGETDPALKPLERLGYKSAIYVPMLVSGRVVGAISAEYFDEYHNFVQSEINTALTIAAQAGVSIQNAQLFEDSRRRAVQFQDLADFTRKIVTTLDRDVIFNTLRDEIPKLIPTSMVSVALRQMRGQTLYIYMLRADGSAITEFNAEETGLTYAASAEVPVMIDDLSTGNYPDYRFFAGYQMRSAAFVPLQIAGRSIGTLNMLHRDKGQYTQSDAALLMQIGASTAAALENARQYRETSQRMDNERMVNQLTGALQNSADLNGLLLSTVQQIGGVIGARRGRVRLWVENKPPVSASGLPTVPVADRPDADWE